MDLVVHTRERETVETVDFLLRKKRRLFCKPVRWWPQFFWNLQGVIYIDYFWKDKTVTELYYIKLLCRFDVELQKKRRLLTCKKGCNNVPAHISAVASWTWKLKIPELDTRRAVESNEEWIAYFSDALKKLEQR